MEVKIMFLSNVEVKGFIRNYLILFIITIGLSIEISFVSINIIKNEVVENNQAIVGNILSKKPEMEDEIIDIIMDTAQTGESGNSGDGRIFVLPVEESYTISSQSKDD